MALSVVTQTIAAGHACCPGYQLSAAAAAAACLLHAGVLEGVNWLPTANLGLTVSCSKVATCAKAQQQQQQQQQQQSTQHSGQGVLRLEPWNVTSKGLKHALAAPLMETHQIRPAANENYSRTMWMQ
jgi:hypothetical protein